MRFLFSTVYFFLILNNGNSQTVDTISIINNLISEYENYINLVKKHKRNKEEKRIQIFLNENVYIFNDLKIFNESTNLQLYDYEEGLESLSDSLFVETEKIGHSFLEEPFPNDINLLIYIVNKNVPQVVESLYHDNTPHIKKRYKHIVKTHTTDTLVIGCKEVTKNKLKIVRVFEFIDDDQDGVLDLLDDCPNTMKAARVNKNGCSDIDYDDILDHEDLCKFEKGPICTNGCPDKDNDCVSDFLDKCPDITGDTLLQGCMNELPSRMKSICEFSLYTQEGIASLYSYGDIFFSGGSRGTLKMYSLNDVYRKRYKLLDDLELEGRIVSIFFRDTNKIFIQNEINGLDKVRDIRISKRKKLRRSKSIMDSTFVDLEVLGFDTRSQNFVFYKVLRPETILYDPLQKKGFSFGSDSILAVQFLENETLMTIDRNGQVKYRDHMGNTDEERNVYLLGDETMSHACISKNGQRIAAVTNKGIKCWQLAEGGFQSLIINNNEEIDSITDITFSEDGSTLLIGFKSGQLKSYHLEVM